MATTFRTVDRATPYFLPQSIEDRLPDVPKPGPAEKDQVNFTDDELRIMPVSGGGFEQAYNARAAVDNDSRLIMAVDLGRSSVVKQALQPVLEDMRRNPEGLTTSEILLADAGYCRKANVDYCEERGIEPLVSFGREQHNMPLVKRCGGSIEIGCASGETPIVCFESKLKEKMR